ncbi:MAG: sigma-70 family RNA polymerase sigma factor [Gemmataceae bacterium]
MADGTSTPGTVQKLFLQHAAALRGFIFGLLGDRESANDVFQEVFLTVTANANQFRPEGNFLAWARGIARNKVLEHFRQRRQQPRLFDAELLDLLAASAGQSDDAWEERRAMLVDCIQELAPRARQILEMRYAETPTSPTDIAQRLAWTVNAVHVSLARTRKFLQDCTRRRMMAGKG